jgi:hypothetical protein
MARTELDSSELNIVRNMIQWLDGYAAFYNADPFRIEKLVNKRKDENDEVSKAWAETRSDVSDIITLPDSSEEIKEKQRKTRIYRPLSAILIFGTGLSVLIISGLHLGLNRFSLIGVLVVLLAVYALVISLWYRSTRQLYRMVREYYRAYGSRASKQRAHIKSVTQGLIDLLTVNIRNGKLDPEKYKMKLFHNDYSNIRVLKEENPKNMDRPLYISVVKARSPSQE